MRLLLRLDGLFRHYATLRDHQNPIHLDDQLNILLRLILVTDRADLKSKMTQLIHLLVIAQKWQQHKNANQETIKRLLKNVKS